MGKRSDSAGVPENSPKLTTHRATGRACVYLHCQVTRKRRTYYLDADPDTPEADDEYRRVCLQWHRADRVLAAFDKLDPKRQAERNTTVDVLIDRFLDDLEDRQVKSVDKFAAAFRPLHEKFGSIPARSFEARDMVELVDYWLAVSARRKVIVDGKRVPKPLSRKTLNERLYMLRQLFKFARRRELIDRETLTDVLSVPLVPANDPRAAPSKGRKPASTEQIDALRDELPEVVWDMITLQSLGSVAMRAGELLGMTLGEIDRSDEVWVYTPSKHKTAWKNRARSIKLGPQSQRIILRYVAKAGTTDPDAPIFPRWLIREQKKAHDAQRREADWEAAQEAERRRAMLEGREWAPRKRYDLHGRQRARRDAVKLTGDDRYTDDPFWDVPAFRRMLTRACERAGVPKFSTHQLRHAAASRLFRELGGTPDALEQVRIVLGHADSRVTRRYIDEMEHEEQVRKDLALKFG